MNGRNELKSTRHRFFSTPAGNIILILCSNKSPNWYYIPGHSGSLIIRCLRLTKFCRVGKTYKCCYETDEVPNPRPTQPEKKQVIKSGIWATSCQQIISRGSGLIFYRKQTTRNATQPNSSANTIIAKPKNYHYDGIQYTCLLYTSPSPRDQA